MSVKKTQKSTKAGSSKTERSQALKAKGKTAPCPEPKAKKTAAAPARGRTVAAKPASKKVAPSKAKAPKTATSRARSAATRQRTVTATAPSRSTARPSKKPASAVKAKSQKPEPAASTAEKSQTSVKTAKGLKASPAKAPAVKTPSKTKTTASTRSVAPSAKTVSKIKAAATSANAPVPPSAVKKVIEGIKKAAASKSAVNTVSQPLKAMTTPPVIPAVIPSKPSEVAPKALTSSKPVVQSVEAPAVEQKTGTTPLNMVAPKVATSVSSSASPTESVATALKKAAETIMVGKAAKTSSTPATEPNLQEQRLEANSPPVAKASEAKPVVKPAPHKPAASSRPGFKVAEFIVYPAHGVGQVIAIEEQEVAGFKLELFVISFIKDKMILKVPTTKVASVGMRKLAEADVVKKALDTLTGRARVKRTMWSRRAQEYEAKINSGDLGAIAEVVRDLYRSDAQPEQSYSERQLYEAALDRLSREIGTVHKLTETESFKLIETQLQKGPRRSKAEDAEAETEDADVSDSEDGEIEEAA